VTIWKEDRRGECDSRDSGQGSRGPLCQLLSLGTYLIYERTILLLAFLWCVTGALALWHFSQLSSKLVESGALKATELYSESLKELRTFYGAEIVDRVKPYGIEVTHDYATKKGAIPIPATFSIEFGKHIGTQIPGMQIRLVSDFPFPYRKDGGPRDSFEREALAHLTRESSDSFFRFEDFRGRPSLRYAVAIKMGKGCVACHNSHPESPKTDWKVGDVRGVQEIIRPLDNVVADTREGLKDTFLLMSLMGLLGLGGLGLVIGKMRRDKTELEQEVVERTATQSRLKALHDINVTMSSTLDLRAVLDLLMEKVSSFFPDIAAQIWLVNPETKGLERAACRNLDEAEWKGRILPTIPALVKEVLTTKSAVVARNVQTDPRTLDPSFYRQQGIISYLGVPLLVKGEVIGDLVLLTRKEHYFQGEEINFLSTLAGQAASAIHNSLLYEQTRRQATELTRSNTELEQFAYVASHDLQEPLRMITGYTNLLAKRYSGKLDQDADEFIAFAVNGAKRMNVLIHDLLSYSRVGTDAKALTRTNCEETLSKTLTSLQMAIKESGATITHDDLPAVLADDTQLGQLFQNLLGNAIKYRGTNPPQIHVGCRREAGWWLFSVRDNGIGIDPKYSERIFVIFQRLHTRDEYSGTGIGLAICKKIVERHGGKIWVESELGQGTTCYFRLPVEPHDPGVNLTDFWSDNSFREQAL
jgi:signal transduction histidine kinase